MTGFHRPERRFNIVLLVRHPDADPHEISRELSLQPHQAFQKGEARTLPNGNLSSSLATQSAWNYVFRHTGEHPIDEAVEAVIKILEDHKAFVHRLCLQGWTFQIYLQLPGDVNVAGVLPWQLAKRMADLRIELGLEVFPKLK